MRLTIVTVGSRGDVQPYVALGKELQAAGHQVRLATHGEFAELARSRTLDFHPLEGNPRGLLESELGQSWLESGGNPLRFVQRMADLMRPILARGLADSWNACQDADAILFSALGWLTAHAVAEKRRIPALAAFLQPASPTRCFPAALFPPHPWLGGLYNRLTYTAGEQLFWRLFREPLNAARHEVLGLAPLPRGNPFSRGHRERWPVLYGYSPSVVPKPPDWGDWLHLTGYWFLDRTEDWDPPAGLVDFLAAQPRPVYVGFGSMRSRDPERTRDLVLAALAQTGQRAVLLTGWGGISGIDLPDNVFGVESVPHDWLFPRVAAVVHHAGAGTSAAGFRAGVPTVAVPFFADQPFWGWCAHHLGVGPKPIAKRRLTVARLAGAIAVAVNHREIRARAATLGQRIDAERGRERAVELVPTLLPPHP